MRTVTERPVAGGLLTFGLAVFAIASPASGAYIPPYQPIAACSPAPALPASTLTYQHCAFSTGIETGDGQGGVDPATSSVYATGSHTLLQNIGVSTNAGGSGDLSYYVQLQGPANGFAAIHIQAQGLTLATGNLAAASASVMVNNEIYGFACQAIGFVCFVPTGLRPGVPTVISPSFFVDTTFAGPVGTFFKIEIQAGAGAGLDSNAAASADPFLEIDPSTPDRDLYSLLISDGIGNAPLRGVPEPATAALVAIALLPLSRAKPRR